MKKTMIFLFLLNICLCKTKGEPYLFKSQHIDAAYSFFRDDNNDHSDRIWFHEHNFFGRVGVSITKSLYAGILLNGIVTKSNMWFTADNEFFLLYGIYTRYYFFDHQKFKLFGETALSYGDYNVSFNYFGQIDEIREKGLFYLGITGGTELRLFIDKLYFTASFTLQPTISKIKEFYNPHPPSQYSHNTFNLGICYYFDLQPNIKLKRSSRNRSSTVNC